MNDKVSSAESTRTVDHSPAEAEPGQSQTPEDRAKELEGLLARKNEELNLANARTSELERALAESDKKLSHTSNALSQAITSYKALLIETNPAIGELITGDSVDEINASLEKTKTLIARLRKRLEEEVATTRVPAGAPLRTAADLSALSAREKIQYAIGGKK